jgi:hypothetical protein
MLRATWCTDVNEYTGGGWVAIPLSPNSQTSIKSIRIRCACGLCHCASHWNELYVYFVCSPPTLREAGFCRYERVRGLLLTVGELRFAFLVNNQLDAQFFFFFLFIPILYMFRTPLCSSPGESIVLIRHLVYVTVCRWPSGVQVWMELPLHTRRSPTYSDIYEMSY